MATTPAVGEDEIEVGAEAVVTAGLAGAAAPPPTFCNCSSPDMNLNKRKQIKRGKICPTNGIMIR